MKCHALDSSWFNQFNGKWKKYLDYDQKFNLLKSLTYMIPLFSVNKQKTYSNAIPEVHGSEISQQFYNDI